MTTVTYVDAMNEALDRLQGIGYEHGAVLVNHAPMAAEALATLGYSGDEVGSWIERNLRARSYHKRPEPRWSLSTAEADWRPELGNFARVADWSALFERELAEQPWETVLHTWWPRLLPGVTGALTHGVIRTAHAVRSIAQANGDDRLQRAELAQGLGYWAARYAVQDEVSAQSLSSGPPEGRADDRDSAIATIDELIAESAGHYSGMTSGHPVPMIHAITGPAAVRLVCEHLPSDQLWPSYAAAKHSSDRMLGYFSGPSSPRQSARTQTAQASPQLPAGSELVAQAIELGDEHAIKLAEVAIRHNAYLPDDRYAMASHAANRRLSGFLQSHTFYE